MTPNPHREAGVQWQTCRIGSCHRHQKCMYGPCRNQEADTPQVPVEPIDPEQTPHPPSYDDAANETARLQRELDITNADHIAVWLEANTVSDEPMSQCISWLACRIVEAHEAALTPAREALREARRLCDQVKVDLSSAHAEICKLQKLDPATHSWPEWTPQANTLLWIDDKLIPQIDAALAKAQGESA